MKATLDTIARNTGFSKSTISRVLNNKAYASRISRETVNIILDEAERCGYVPNLVAKNLRTNKTQTLGLLVPSLANPYFAEIASVIVLESKRYGYTTIVADTMENETNQNASITALLSKQVDGIVYVTSHERILKKSLPEHLPVPASMAYGYSKSDEYPSVAVDDKNGAYTLIRYLIDRGHKSIGVITGKEESIHTLDRLRGYQKALYDQKIFFDPDIVVQGDWKRESGYNNTDYLLSKGVTAIFCMNDIMAGGVYDRLEERGVLPGRDISVVGFDNRDLSNYYKPPLTTIALPLSDIGYTACKMVIDMIEKKERGDSGKTAGSPWEIHEACSLLIRNSVVDLKGAGEKAET